MTTTRAADLLRARARGAAGPGQVALLRTLYAAGVPRWLVRSELRAGRWRRYGRQVVVLHNGPLPADARRRVAVLAAGPRAVLDGVSSLQEQGVPVTDDLVHVLVPKGWRRVRVPFARVHESRRWRAADVRPGHPPCTAPAVASVHAALWARTDREARHLLVLPVQQGVVRPQDLHDAVLAVARHARRRLLRSVVVDLLGGVRSLGELDVAAALRRRGLPEPVRQAVKLRPSGTQYLDADFPEHGVTLEVDGSQHDLPGARLADLLRDLALAAEGRTVVRLPLVAWRLDEEAVLDALESLFLRQGWRRPAA